MRRFLQECSHFFNIKQNPAHAGAAGTAHVPQGLTLRRGWAFGVPQQPLFTKYGWLLLLLFCMASVPAVAQTGLSAKPQVVYDNDVENGAAGTPRRIVVTNTSGSALVINSIALTGKDAGEFQPGNLPQLPATLAPNDSVALTVAFAPASIGLKTAVINITTSDSLNSLSVPLRGLGTAGIGSTNEPSLQALFNLFQISVSAGDDAPATNVINSNTASRKAALLGDEVPLQQFRKAGPGNVVIEPLAVFGPTASNPVVGMGWYASGNRNSRQELFTVANNPASNAQTAQVAYNGTTVFDPGTATFGFYSRWPFFKNRALYSEDSLNIFKDSIPHHVRVYPYIKQGVREPDAYVVAFEEDTSGFDYQDILFIVRNVRPAANDTTIRLAPKADAFVARNSGNTNYGMDTALQVQAVGQNGAARNTLLSFPLQATNDIQLARLRLYGRNKTGAQVARLQVAGLVPADWSENNITFNNAPAAEDTALGTLLVGGAEQYYELDVTSFVKARFARGKSADFVIRDTAAQQQNVLFNSREHGANPPQLVIATSAVVPAGNADLFIENLDRFPANDRFVASRLQNRWTRDTVPPYRYNANHDTAQVRIRNNGASPLVVKGLELSNKNNWKYLRLGKTNFDTTAFPLIINPGAFTDLTLQFIHNDPLTDREIRLLVDTLVILSNDATTPRKLLWLQGLWQRYGEGSREPTAQQTIRAFGFKTETGFPSDGKDPDQGNAAKPKGDEILTSYFVRADSLKPVTIRQMSAYHGCCTQTENIEWFPKGDKNNRKSVVRHIGDDAQSLLPRRTLATGLPAEGSFSTTGAFGFRVGPNDYSDTLLTPYDSLGNRKIGIRVWKAIDFGGNIIPDTYIMANDYLGSDFTNYDYNDNMYYVTNVRPELGPAGASLLTPTPSAFEFGEKLTGTVSSAILNLQSGGKTYPGGASDPDITIKSIAIVGENKGEFRAAMPQKTTLVPQETTTLAVNFKPLSEGLKIADLLIYYNNSRSPLRVPLYGIAKDSGTTVNLHYRIKGGSDTAVTINGNKWESDNAYAFDNLEPYINPQVKEIEATDDDALYFIEQSSDSTKRPFRYVLPLDSGAYAVRLHFSEVYFGTPGKGLNGGTGSRVMGVVMENEVKIANLDIVKEAGVAAALVRNVPVKVTDGKLDMNFTATVNRPSLSALEVYSFKRTTPVPPPADTTTPPPLVDTTVVPPPPPPTDTTVTPPPPIDTTTTPPPPTDTVTTPPPVDTVIVTPPPPVDTVIVTPPPPVDTVVITPPPVDTTTPPPPVDTVVVTPPPPVDTVVVTPPPPVDTVIVTPPTDTTITLPPPVRLLVYPNPNTGRFTVVFPLTRRQTVKFLITDVVGRRYGEEKIVGDAGNNKKEIDLTRLRLKPGTYLLEMYYEEKRRDVLKILLE